MLSHPDLRRADGGQVGQRELVAARVPRPRCPGARFLRRALALVMRRRPERLVSYWPHVTAPSVVITMSCDGCPSAPSAAQLPPYSDVAATFVAYWPSEPHLLTATGVKWRR